MSSFYYVGGTLLFLALAILVAVLAWQRTKRVPCHHCGLSIAPNVDKCPFCHASQA